MVYIACTLSINIWPLFVEQARISQLAIFGAFFSTHCDVLVSLCGRVPQKKDSSDSLRQRVKTEVFDSLGKDLQQLVAVP